MSDLAYGQFSQTRFQFVVEDVAYDWAPSKFERLDGDDGVRGESIKTLGLNRQIVVPRPVNEQPWVAYLDQATVYSSGGTPTDYHANPRFVTQQAWRASWEEAYVDLCMRDHFYLLYSLQKPFWIQFDEEMSHDCVRLESLGDDRKAFITPTYPVAYYRVSDPAGKRQVQHAYMQVFLNNAPATWDNNPWRFDAELGLLTFENSIQDGTVVSMKYIWRAYVRIREISFTIAAYSQGPYTGSVIFEQMPAPAAVDRYDTTITRPPCRRCPDNKYSDGTSVEECTDFASPAVVSSRSRTGSAWAWDVPANVKSLDNLRAEVEWTDDGNPKSEWLYASQYNFTDLPDDEIERKLTKATVAVYGFGNANYDEVRLTLNGNVVGDNAASMEYMGNSEQAVFFTFDVTDYGITYADALSAKIGVVVGAYSLLQILADVNWIGMKLCYDEGIDNPPPPGNCGCNTTDKVSTSTDISVNCLTYDWYERVSGFGIPTDHYVHGVEIMSAVIGSNNGCPVYPSSTALFKSRLRLNRVGSTMSSYFQKGTQPVPPTDHATVNYIDSTTDPSFGGVNDLWGRPFGAWTPAMVNNDGLEFEFYWHTDCAVQQVDLWAVSYVYNGTTEHSAGQVGDPQSFAWGSSPAGGYRDYARGTGTPNYVSLAGTITVVFTWIGGGTAPTSMTGRIYSKAIANAMDGPGAGYWNGAVSNGFDDNIDIGYVSGFETSRNQEGTHDVLLNVVGGVASYVVACSAYSYKSLPTSGGLQVYGGVLVTGAVPPCVYPQKQPATIRVHHSPVCSTHALCHQIADETGTWNRPSSKGLNCNLMQTSDGTTNGAFTLLMYGYELELFKANTRIVGIQVDGEYRKVGPATRGDTITLKAHIGTYNGGRTGKTLAYPSSSTWTTFTVGGNGQFWDYTSTYAETGVAYPTALGSSVNSLFELEMLGSNLTGTFYEMRNVKVTLYFAEVCDGL